VNARALTPRRLGVIGALAILTATGAILAATSTGGRGHAPRAALGRSIETAGPRTAAVAPPMSRTALRTSEAFAGGYLAFIYGRAPAAAIPYASGALLARLSRLHPEPPAAAAGDGDPQLTSVQVVPAGSASATASAVIDDRGAIDPVTMRLARTRGGWTVVDLAETG
jgi:hypothetical protein